MHITKDLLWMPKKKRIRKVLLFFIRRLSYKFFERSKISQPLISKKEYKKTAPQKNHVKADDNNEKNSGNG